MNLFVTFGALLLSCVVTMSNSQGYIRLSRSDPMMSLLLSSKKLQRETTDNGSGILTNDNEPDIYAMKRGNKGGRKNFLDFIFRKYNDDDLDLDKRNKRIRRPNLAVFPILIVPHRIGANPNPDSPNGLEE